MPDLRSMLGPQSKQRTRFQTNQLYFMLLLYLLKAKLLAKIDKKAETQNAEIRKQIKESLKNRERQNESGH